MKKTWFFFLFFCGLFVGLQGQDRVLLTNGSLLKGQILDEAGDSVKFVLQDMPSYSLVLPKTKVKKLTYDKKRSALEQDSSTMETQEVVQNAPSDQMAIPEAEELDLVSDPSNSAAAKLAVPSDSTKTENTNSDLTIQPRKPSEPILPPKDAKWQFSIQVGPAMSKAYGDAAKAFGDSISSLNETTLDENISYKGGNNIQLGGVFRMDLRRKLNEYLGYRIGVEGLWSSWQTVLKEDWEDPEIQFDKRDTEGLRWRSLWTNLYLEGSLRFAQNYEVYGGLKLGLSMFEQLERINVHEVWVNNELDDNSWDESLLTDLEPYRLMPAYRIGASWVGENKWGLALEHSRMLRKDPATPYQQGLTSLQIVRQF